MGASHNIATIATAALLTGCGVVQGVTNTALSPVMGVSQAVSQTLGAAGGAASQTATALGTQARMNITEMGASARSVAEALPSSQTAPASPFTTAALPAASQAPIVSTPPPTYVPPPKLSKEQKEAIAKAKDAPQPELPVLPQETLAVLTVDQRGLQDAAQRSALNGPVGDELSWDDDGRSGTAKTEDEHDFGERPCRAFIETVTIDGKKTEGRAMACKDADSGRWSLAF